MDNIDNQPWRVNYKAMNVQQLKKQVEIIKLNAHKYNQPEARLAFIAEELAIKAGR